MSFSSAVYAWVDFTDRSLETNLMIWVIVSHSLSNAMVKDLPKRLLTGQLTRSDDISSRELDSTCGAFLALPSERNLEEHMSRDVFHFFYEEKKKRPRLLLFQKTRRDKDMGLSCVGIFSTAG